MCILLSVISEIPENGVRYVYLIQIRWCSEYFTYVYVYTCIMVADKQMRF